MAHQQIIESGYFIKTLGDFLGPVITCIPRVFPIAEIVKPAGNFFA